MIDHAWTAVGLLAAVAAILVAFEWLIAIGRGISARWRPPLHMELPQRWPSVTVIVPAWNERGTIEVCLATLRWVDYPTWDIVVVAGGDDGTFEAAVEAAAALPHATVVQQPPGGKPAALTAGVALATGEIVVLLDADSRVAPGWLRALVAPMDRAIRATSGRPVAIADTTITRVEVLERIAAYDVRRQTVLQGSGSIAIERTVLDEVGGFAPGAFADDWELDARLALRGNVRAYCRDAVVVTERPSTLGEFWTNEVRWRRAHLRSLGRVGAYFLGSPGIALANLYPYAIAWMTAILAGLALGAFVAGEPEMTAPIGALALIVVGASLAQRVTLSLEVLAYDGESQRLRDLAALLGLFLVTLVACLVATVSIRRATLRFKGPRSIRREVRL